MITAVHALVYSDEPELTRAFFRDVLGWPYVDAHGSWLIFRTGPSELGVHPSSGFHNGHDWSTRLHHEISLMCDDIHTTVHELTAKGAEFVGEIEEHSFGLTTRLRVPGAGDMVLYQPHHPVAYNL